MPSFCIDFRRDSDFGLEPSCDLRLELDFLNSSSCKLQYKTVSELSLNTIYDILFINLPHWVHE